MKPSFLLASAAGFGLLLASNPLLAQASPGVTLAPGSYRCMSYNVAGRGASCASSPRLILSPDGTYQYSSTRGNWTVRNGKLHLSASSIWGPGTVVSGETVRFEYDYRNWRHVMTWVCQGCSQQAPAPEPAQTTPAAASAGSWVGVTLTLEFSQAIGGVSGFVIVPVDAARGYAHNDPLPPGAVSGLAWETGATSVRLATNRDNRLPSGRRYVVFLSWPRETIPVAILDLPPLDRDYTGALPATLDGASVISRLGR